MAHKPPFFAVEIFESLTGSFAVNTAQDDECAGYNSLNWNSGNVSSGRYTVTIEHNGSISGKNVLLK